MGRPARHAGHPGRAAAHPLRPGPDLSRPLAGAVPSPNIWRHTSTYELENHATDPDGRLWSTLVEQAPWEDRVVLDLGCGTGFHLPAFAETAATVVGVEPHPDLVALARRRTAGLDHVRVVPGTAQRIPLPDHCVDVLHVRLAYFFGPGCEPGLPELDRVVRRGGTAVVIDNDGSRSTFGAWFRRGYPRLPPPSEIERFWSSRGWERTSVDMGWRFTSRADLEAVVRIELDRTTADAVLAEHEGLEVDYAVNLWRKDF